METIILASGSPRRQELLTKARIPFRVIPPNIDEAYESDDVVEEIVKKLAEKKVMTIVSLFKNESPRWILGVDTLVDLNGSIIGKPKNLEDAREVIYMLAGKKHRVVSGICLLPSKNDKPITKVATTDVKFKDMSDEEINYYINTGEWSGVAGGYRIQGIGSFFIERINGSFSNVMGLPMETFYGILKESNYNLE